MHFFSDNFFLVKTAGPGFDSVINMGDHSLAADNVQCIHTNSYGYGTTTRNCSQNWCMGICGMAQIGASAFPKGHHGELTFSVINIFNK